MIYSSEDDAQPSDRLVSTALEATRRARAMDLGELDRRETGSLGLANLWPGEHYRLLAGLVGAIEPRRLVEIGTGSGLSALAMLSAMPSAAGLVTFDLVPWDGYPGGVLRSEDFSDQRLEQLIEDISRPEIAAKRRGLLAEAEFVFVDAAKDGLQEQLFLDLFETVNFEHAPIVMFDDVRVWNMLAIWRGIRRPKLDVTSFGHWSGTGLVDYA